MATVPVKLRVLLETKAFNIGIIILIVLGAITVGLSTYENIMARWGLVIHGIDIVIIALFSGEIVLRIFSEGRKPWRYFLDPWNLFDFVIVGLCLLPLDNDAVVVLRVFRLLRVLRIFRALPKLRLIIRGIVKSISSVGYVAALLAVHFYIFAVIGVSVFAHADPEHFGHLGHAFLTLFQVITLENWPDVMAPVKAAHPVGGVLYFVVFIITGTMVVMNLFVGVIVGGMSEAIQEAKDEFFEEKKIPSDAQPVGDDLQSIQREMNAVSERLASFIRYSAGKENVKKDKQ
jgi:voltage-gated sodium channel